jgi:recombination protein RecR
VRDADVREIVIATNPTTTGEATALHIAAAIRTIAPQMAITRLASGLPVGSDLEYADELTLGRAFSGRRAV